jgi:hypothetical protein
MLAMYFVTFLRFFLYSEKKNSEDICCMWLNPMSPIAINSEATLARTYSHI